jgi:hypothetical protein
MKLAQLACALVVLTGVTLLCLPVLVEIERLREADA